MDAILAFFLAPVAVFGAFALAGFWISAVYICAIGWCVYDIFDNSRYGYDFEFSALIGFAIATFLFLYLGNFDSETAGGFWSALIPALGDTLEMLFKSAIYYVVWGILLLAPLWVVDNLRFARKKRRAEEKFPQKVKEEISRINDRLKRDAKREEKTFVSDIDNAAQKKEARQITELGKEETEQVWRYTYEAEGLKKDTSVDALSSDGVSRIMSLVFLWPLHVIERLLGELVKEIPEILSRVFGRFLNRIGSMFGGDLEGGPPSLSQ